MFKLSSDHLANFRSIGALLETFKGWINDLRLRIGNTEDRLDVLEAAPSGGGITLPIDAVDVDYDNTTSGLTATDVQAAIDELAALPTGSAFPHQFDDSKTFRAPLRLSADGLTLTNYSSLDIKSAAVSYPCRHEDSKVYFEVNITGTPGFADIVGFITNDVVENLTTGVENADYYYQNAYYNGTYFYRNTSTNGSSAFGSSWGTNPVIGIAVDRVGGKVYISINGTWQGGFDPADDDSTHQSDTWKYRFRAYCCAYNTGISMELVARESDMTYSVPTGYVALAG